MYGRLLLFVFIISLFCACSTVEKSMTGQPVHCAVMMFESRAGMNTGEAESVTEIFSTALQNSGRFIVVERNRIDAILKEREFQAMQDEENIAKTGKLLAIKKMFSGSIGKLGDDYVVNLKMIDVESSSVDIAILKNYDDNIEEIGNEFIPGLVQEILKKYENIQNQ